ncbi:hypothetical protein HF086_003818 [Spodoptera exigua]|uniref:Uncharacterized protein n=1 Tax=Spodoptera exigua TaxID=7107 RepID=A0A922MXF5_SPOEX|nr:hypothetical protein HF086_003818 [Spodoptera exigua]
MCTPTDPLRKTGVVYNNKQCIRYIPHIESTLQLVQQEHTKMNYVHGLLLQLVQLLQAGGGALQAGGGVPQPGGGAQQAGAGLLRGWEWAPRLRPVLWRLRAPCYLVADELVKIINLLVMR